MKKQSKLIMIIISICILIGICFTFIININFFLNNDIFSNGKIIENLNCDILDVSLLLGTQFLLNNQRPEGNFNYEYDWINKEFNKG